jgi:DNA helicase II / ATP-dependent DNA helicase PcrA
MPIPETAKAAAQLTQHATAHSTTPQTRLIAGPGTGKSATIVHRLCWLLDHGVESSRIYVVSFTRASANDLKERIISACETTGHAAAVTHIQVSTLHSLALKTLRAGGLLTRFPTLYPLVLDEWELKNVFDAEFGISSEIRSTTRQKEIRRYHEAIWSTGVSDPSNYIPPDPAISAQEANTFVAFHTPRTETYACVLPGEIVRQCVEEFNTGNLDVVGLLHMEHLIVDEFQDLNPMDLEFVDLIIQRGVAGFLAGDDDQSVYSFRFANPAGIQQIPQNYPAAGLHQLTECFRSMPGILNAAATLITAFPPQNRIPKNLQSLYSQCQPTPPGIVHLWRFTTGVSEAQAIAESCRDLTTAGISPKRILILLSNRRALGPEIIAHLQGENVPFTVATAEDFRDSDIGRLLLSVLRIVCDGNDYVAHRTLLGIRDGVGVGTCNVVCESVIGAGSLNYRRIFYDPLPAGVFSTRGLRALNAAREICAQIAQWTCDDQIGARRQEIGDIIEDTIGPAARQQWESFSAALPDEMTLQEMRDYVWADSDEQQATILQRVYTRLGQDVPADAVLPERVRLMTMHGAKGLSASVVFIPGLEDTILPGTKRVPYPGLVLEAARLLYVSITRARAVCVISNAYRRFLNGKNVAQAPSRFTASLGGAFQQRPSGLQAAEIQDVVGMLQQI